MGYGKSLITLAAGIIIGISSGFFIFQNNSSKKETNLETPAKKTIPVASTHFTNPLSESDAYRGFEIRPTPKLRQALEENTKALIAQGKATSISVYFRDLTNDKVIGINEENMFSPASLLKVPVLITILKYVQEFPATLQHTMLYSGASALITEKQNNLDKKTIMIPGRTYTLDQLLEIMIMESDNEATLLLLHYIDEAAPGYRQSVEKELKLITDNKNFDEDFLTVRRYSSFFRILYNASYLNKEMSEKALKILSETGFGNGIRQAVPANTLVCQKYGHRELSKNQHQYHHFAIVYHPQKPFLIGIMTKGKSELNLQSTITTIAEAAYTSIDTFAEKKPSYLSRDVD